MTTAAQISLTNAKQHKLFYVVANVIVYRASDQRCFIAKRSNREVAHPGKYAVPGGKLEWKDLNINHPTRINNDVLDYEQAIERLLIRETKEETGLEIEPMLYYINSVAYIRPDETPTVMVKFAARYKAGEVKLEESAFSDYAWVNTREVAQYPCIQGIPEEIEKTILIFSK